MKAKRISPLVLIFLALQETSALAQEFGHFPFVDAVKGAATKYGSQCPNLTPFKLMAYLLAPTWSEVTDTDLTLTPAPMTLSRGDKSINFFMLNQDKVGDHYHRAFWHPGIGAWQLDDGGFAKTLGIERFHAVPAADSAAKKIADLYCSCINPDTPQCAASIFGPSTWVSCGSDGSICWQTFQAIYNPNGPPAIDEDYSTDSLGGSEYHVCIIAGMTERFHCLYVDTARAEGYINWTTSPDPAGLWPLAKPFYVYNYPTTGTATSEHRYWLAVDGPFPMDIRAARTLINNSRNTLDWKLHSAPNGDGLCDLTRPHGDACLGQYGSDGATPIVLGDSTDENTVKFRALMSDPGGQPSRLEVELRQLKENGGAFNGTRTQTSPMITAGNVAEATANGLVGGYYHWQARIVNAAGQESPWQSFGGNPDGATDFSVGHGGKLIVKATVDGSPYSGPVSYSVSGAASFTGTRADTYSNLPEGVYTLLNVSGGPDSTSFGDIVPATTQPLTIGGTISWTLAFTTNQGPFCSANSGTNLQSTTSETCGGRLSVTLAGSGNGRVVSNPSGIDCSVGTCSTSLASGTQVALSVNPAVGSTFAGWSGSPDCIDGSVTINGDRSCTATFTATSIAYALAVAKTGNGTVTSSDGGINCGGNCSHTYLGGTTVTLAASAASGWSFSSWSDNCSGGPVVQFSMTSNMSCTASFTQNSQPTPVTTTGGATNITADSATLNGTINPEGFAATAFFEYGPDPNLGNATPGIGFGPGNNSFFPFAQTVAGLACATTYRFRAVGVSAGGEFRTSNNTFTTWNCPPAPCHTLNLIPNGDVPAPIPSPANAPGCPNGQYHEGDHVALTAVPVPGDVVTGWGGTDNDASIAFTNTVTISFPYNRAVFAIEQHICYHLSLGHTGNGSALAVTNPVGYCPADYFPWGYQVHVNASPATGWKVGSWNGTLDDASTSTFNIITMPTANHAGLVQYVPIQYSLQVFKEGNGSGTVVSDLPGINCGATCSATYPHGTNVTLSAIPARGSSFGDWSGACTGGVVSFPPGAVCFPKFVQKATDFYTLTPCRVLDTRDPNDPNHPAIQAGEVRVPTFAGKCGIPSTATAVSVNVTVVNPSTTGFLSLSPVVSTSTSTISFGPGQVRANNAVIGLNDAGGLTVFCGMASGAVDYIVDVNGYFAGEGSGAGPTFAQKFDRPTGAGPWGLAVSDFDGDGKADIAVGIYNHGSGDHLTIFRNTGSIGQLRLDSLPLDIPTGQGPIGIAAGDLDNDGKVDLVSANADTLDVSVLRNTSTRGFIDFQPVFPRLPMFGTPHRVVIADFDKDGRPDLIVTSNSGSLVSIFHHASDPNSISFDYRRDFSASSSLSDIAVADIDRDTRPEVLVPLSGLGLLTMFQNSSSPGDVEVGSRPSLAAGVPPIGEVAVGDLDNDHTPDIVVGGAGGLVVFQNSSSPGAFDLLRMEVPTGTTPDALAIGDLDKDGPADVVAANPTDNSISVLLNRSAGGAIVLTPLEERPATGLGPITLALEDMDGDGWLDAVVTNHDGDSISILLNTSGGH